jgi:choline dehydrogenase-like flavoprotein
MRWSGICPRILEYEFRARTVYGAMENTSLIDWPLTLEELEPYYDKAEAKMGVSGTNGLPASAENNNFKVLKAGARRVGYKDVTTTRIAINSVAYDGRPACRQIGFCTEGCAIGAKWSTLYTEVPKAEQTDHFELRTGAMVVKINHDRSGKVTGVIYRDESGASQEQKARAVCVAGNVVETTRLLMLSESALFPNGLANSSGQLGKNYMRHLSNVVWGIMPGGVNGHRGARAGLIRDERAHNPERGFAGGYLLELNGLTPGRHAALAGWGADAQRWMENFANSAGLLMIGEDPPQESNRISLHPTDKDDLGLPIPVIEYARHENTNVMVRHARARAHEIYASLGATDIRDNTDSLGGGCHNMGVARMCADPKDGVTDRFGQAHDVPNLFVSDGSTFSTSAGCNPTLTIVALAIRQAEHIAERMSRREL